MIPRFDLLAWWPLIVFIVRPVVVDAQMRPNNRTRPIAILGEPGVPVPPSDITSGARHQ